MKKKTIYCPFCSMIWGINQKYKGGNLHTMENADFVHFKCHFCNKPFWILESDFNKLGV